MLPVFKHSEDVEFWVRRKPRDVAAAFAARAALRVIPLLAPGFRLGGQDEFIAREHSTLLAFRGVQAAWAVAAFPEKNDLLRRAAQAAGSSSEDGSARPSGSAYDAQSAAALAAAAAGTDDDSRRFTPRVVLYALGAAGVYPSTDMLSACAGDANKLDEGYSPASLALYSTLWPGMPDWAFDAWAKLEQALLDANEDWWVWTNWYEARLKGAGADQAVEVARAAMPEPTWNQGPAIVNAQIRRLVEGHGLWRTVTASVSPLRTSAPTEPDPDATLKQKLAGLSLDEIAVIGTRAVLRAVPLMSFGSVSERTFSTALLKLLRVASLTWAAASYPTQTPNRVVLNAARIDALNTRTGLLRAAAAATAAFSAKKFDKIIEEVTGGLNMLRSASSQADGAATRPVFDLALSQDLNDLDGAPNGAAALAQFELWPGGAPPEWTARRWETLKRDLIRAGLGWEVWVDWYEDRLAGHVRSEAREFAYATVPNELWQQAIGGDPAVVNTWIMRQVDPLAGRLPSEPSTSDIGSKPPPTIPAQQPAAIEPVWSKGQLKLPKTAAKSDLKGRKFTAALQSLREELSAFATEIAGEANIDRRFVSYIRKLADQIPQKSPKQAELFRLGHAGEVFAGYAKTVDDEWPDVLARQFHALALHFDRTMRQSPLWREFKRNAAQERLTAEQVGNAASLAAAVATALRDDEAAAFTDPAIPQTLENLAEPLQAAGEDYQDNIEAGKQELALDVVESVSNIFKRIAEGALAAKAIGGIVVGSVGSTLRDAGADYARGAGKGIKRAAKRQGPKDGEKAFKWLRRAVIAAGGYGVGAALGLPQLIAAYPQAFAWLQALLKHFP